MNQRRSGLFALVKEEFVRAKRPVRFPNLLSSREVTSLMEQLYGTPRLMADLFYGAGAALTPPAS